MGMGTEVVVGIVIFTIGIFLLYIIVQSPFIYRILVGDNMNTYLMRLDKTKYITMKDVAVPLGNGKLMLIDTVIVSTYGIFLMNIYQEKGQVRGEEHDFTWIQENKGKEGNFPNPLTAQKQAMKAVQKVLRHYLHVPYVSMVVFNEGVNTEQVKTSTPNVYVINRKEMLTTILNYRKPLLSWAQMNEICMRLSVRQVNKKIS